MRRKALPAALLWLTAAATLAAGCSSTLWKERRRVDAAGTTGRLLVPRLYEPLVPGSIYPNRRKPMTATSRPAVLVVLPRRGDPPVTPEDVITPFGERGMVVLVVTVAGDQAADAGRIAEAGQWLASRPECRKGSPGLLLVEPDRALLKSVLERSESPAIAVSGLDPRSGFAAADSVARPPRARLMVQNLAGAARPTAELSERFKAALGAEPVEKWYRPAEKGAGFPPEAWRDAADWLYTALADGQGPG